MAKFNIGDCVRFTGHTVVNIVGSCLLGSIIGTACAHHDVWLVVRTVGAVICMAALAAMASRGA